jgi:hypothetical protein
MVKLTVAFHNSANAPENHFTFIGGAEGNAYRRIAP